MQQNGHAPAVGSVHTKGRGTTNKDWWPELLNIDILALLHALDHLPQQPYLCFGFAQAVRALLLQPQDLDRLRAHQQAEDYVRGCGVPLA